MRPILPTRTLAVLAGLLFPLLALAPASASDLDQRIGEGQAVATDRAELGSGHVDLGPRYDEDGTWTLMVHDDTDTGGSVWRSLDRTVLRVHDTAVQRVPDDPAYSFLGVEPGRRVHVVPQTQDPDVVWIGWNTQDPRVMETVDRGVTLSLSGVQGPGELVVYLQDGGFGEPDVLWDSTVTDAQPLWVDVNTHTHANWVFTEPGVYLVTVEVSAELVDQTTATGAGTLRVAVGDRVPVDEAYDAVPARATDPESPAAAVVEEQTREPEGGSTAVLASVAGGAVLLVLLAVLLAGRSRAARRRARAGTAER